MLPTQRRITFGRKHNFDALHPRYNQTFNEDNNGCLDDIIKYLLPPFTRN